MTEGIIVAVITVIGAVIAAMIQGNVTASKLSGDLDKKLAVSDTKLEELTREVREHNNFAQRMPVVEEQIKVINHRLDDLERADK
jgi:uncharacterized membrane-anchored protein YhcB (DUF1043 family)